MLRTGCERSVITYSALISACEKAGQWQLALNLFNEMLRERCTPNVITYNSLITACAQVGGPGSRQALMTTAASCDDDLPVAGLAASFQGSVTCCADCTSCWFCNLVLMLFFKP